jgi:hypothetical protein
MKMTLFDWEVGFNKIGLTKLLQVELGYSLAPAKAATDAVLACQAVVIEVPDGRAEQLAADLKRLGVRLAE